MRPYLFGARPAFGDFGLWAQLYECWTDPTAGALIEGRAPRVLAWIQRMLWPRAEGEFGRGRTLEPTLLPFLERQRRARCSCRGASPTPRRSRAGEREFSVDAGRPTWTQKPQKYHAKSLAVLRAKYAAAASKELDAVLDGVGCLSELRAS